MSETVSPTPATLDAPAPNPVAGTTPPEQTPSPAVSAPAADSPPDLSPDPASTKPATSLLGTAAPKPDGEATEPAAAAPDGEAPAPPAEAPAEPLPLPAYEPFTIPEGVQLNDDQVAEFQKLLGSTENRLAQTPAEAHAAMQEMGQQLLDLYIKDTQEAAQRHARLNAETWTRTREGWVSDFREDPDIGGARQDQTLARAGAMLELYGQRIGPQHEAELRSLFDLTGAGDHAAMLRFMNWAADYAIERPRMVAATGIRGPQPMSRSQRLYRNSIPTNGAA